MRMFKVVPGSFAGVVDVDDGWESFQREVGEHCFYRGERIGGRVFAIICDEMAEYSRTNVAVECPSGLPSFLGTVLICRRSDGHLVGLSDDDLELVQGALDRDRCVVVSDF